MGDRSWGVSVDTSRRLMARGARHAWGETGHANDEFAGTGMSGCHCDSGGQVEHAREESHLSGVHGLNTPDSLRLTPLYQKPKAFTASRLTSFGWAILIISQHCGRAILAGTGRVPESGR